MMWHLRYQPVIDVIKLILKGKSCEYLINVISYLANYLTVNLICTQPWCANMPVQVNYTNALACMIREQ